MLAQTVALPRPFRARSVGFGLLEVILVFALLLGGAAVVFSGFTSANASSKATGTVDQVNVIVANLRASSFGLNHDFTNLDTATAVHAGVVPPSMIQADGAPATAYGPILIAQSLISPRQFDINLNFIPDDGAECAKVLAAFGQVGFDDILVAGSGPSDSGGSVYTNGKLDMSKVGFWCSGENTSDATVGMDLIGH